MTTFSPYENGMKEYFQTGFNTNTNVSIRGGNDKVNYYSSLSYKKYRLPRLTIPLKDMHSY